MRLIAGSEAVPIASACILAVVPGSKNGLDVVSMCRLESQANHDVAKGVSLG